MYHVLSDTLIFALVSNIHSLKQIFIGRKTRKKSHKNVTIKQITPLVDKDYWLNSLDTNQSKFMS